MAIAIDIEKSIKSELKTIVRELVDSYDLYGIEYDLDIDQERGEIGIVMDIYTDKVMEISEYCSIDIEQLEYISDIEIPDHVNDIDDIDDPELREKVEKLVDELYDQCIDDTLSEINENAIYIDMRIESDLVEIYSEPITCDGDYCKTGGQLTIVIKSLDYSDIQYALYIIKNAIKLYLDLHFN